MKFGVQFNLAIFLTAFLNLTIANASDCTFESFGLSKDMIGGKSASTAYGDIRISELEGEGAHSLWGRVLKTMEREWELINEYDRQILSFEVVNSADLTKHSPLFELQKKFLASHTDCVEGVGQEKRSFSGSHFVVVKAKVDAEEKQYLVRSEWSE